MSLILLLNPITPSQVTDTGGGFVSLPPPTGGLVQPELIFAKFLPKASTALALSQGSTQHHSTSKKPVTYLFDTVIAPPATVLGNPQFCHVRVAGRPIALLGGWGTGHAPFGPPHPPHATGVWKIITTSSKLRVKGLPAARLGDSTSCGHTVVKAYPRLLTVLYLPAQH